MTRNNKKFSKEILHLNAMMTLPPGIQEGDSAIISMITKLKREKRHKVFIGINSVNRAMINDEASTLLVASGVNPPLVINHLLTMAANTSLPVIPLSSNPTELGQQIGLKSAAVVALSKSVPQDITDLFKTYEVLLENNDLPNLLVETDVFIPKKKITKKE